MRLRRLQEEFAGSLEIEWRSFLLRPHPGQIPRDLDQFREYTRSWRRPAEQGDGGTFREWATDEGPPSHSVPPHVAAKAAAELGREAFDAMHRRLLHAYFAENRDITRVDVLFELWKDAGLPEKEFSRTQQPELVERIAAEHNEAVQLGVNGVPAVRLADNEVPFMGAHPFEVYRKWVQKALDAGGTSE